MSGTFGEMGNLLRQAQQMQRELDKAREELKKVRVEGSGGGGAVKVEVDGEGMVHRVTIQPDAAGDPRLLEEIVLAAVRDGISRAQKQREERLGRVTGGLSLPWNQ